MNKKEIKISAKGFVQKHKPNITASQAYNLESMLSDFAISEISKLQSKESPKESAEDWLNKNCKPKDWSDEANQANDYIHTSDVIKYMEEYAAQKSNQTDIPSDEEIERHINNLPYYGHCTTEYNEGFKDGIDWYKSRQPLNT